MILDVILYYFSILKELLVRIWDKLPITENVSYLMLLVALMLILTFISVLRFSFGGNGLYAIKSYNHTLKVKNEQEKLSKAKHVYHGKHQKER